MSHCVSILQMLLRSTFCQRLLCSPIPSAAFLAQGHLILQASSSPSQSCVSDYDLVLQRHPSCSSDTSSYRNATENGFWQLLFFFGNNLRFFDLFIGPTTWGCAFVKIYSPYAKSGKFKVWRAQYLWLWPPVVAYLSKISLGLVHTVLVERELLPPFDIADV